MAIQSKENPLNYTGLSYEDIKSQINASLRSDERFANFVDELFYDVIKEVGDANEM